MATWKIKDLKGVGDVELELDDSKRVFVFLGSNGVGKTKTLEAIFKLLSYTLNVQIEDFELSKKNQYVNFITENIELFNGIRLTKTFSISIANNIAIFDDVAINVFNNSPWKDICFVNSKERSYISDKETTNKNQLEKYNPYNIRNWIISKAQSVNPYQKRPQKGKNEIECFLEALHTIDNSIENDLGIDNGEVFLTVDGKELELSQLSSGFTSVVRIVQSIISAYSNNNETENLLESQGVVLIDEIENHLHLEWQTKIIPTLKKLFPNTIFYIATHSPLVLSQLSQGEAYLLKRDEDGVVRSQMIKSPNKRIFSSVLQDGFDIDLNKLKRENMVNSDQTKAKKRLLELLQETKNRQGDLSD